MKETNLLLDWLVLARPQLENAGYVCRIQDRSRSRTCIAVDVDSRRFVGTISYWHPGKFEFQFNARASGEVVALETRNFFSMASLTAFVEELLDTLEVSPPS